MQLVGEVDAAYGAPHLRLEGGTALAAYHLRHRESEDLDFFADFGFNARDFGERVRASGRERGVEIDAAGPANPGFARYVARGEGGAAVRLDFAATSPFRLLPLDRAEEGIAVASYRDLCAGKLHAICDRFEERDFLDLHVIVGRDGAGEDERRRRFAALVDDVIRVDPGLDPASVGRALGRGRGKPLVGRVPLRLLLPLADASVQETIQLGLAVCGELAARGPAT